MLDAQIPHRGQVESILGQVSGISQWAENGVPRDEKELLTTAGAEGSQRWLANFR